jgi:hypothetical protein
VRSADVRPGEWFSTHWYGYVPAQVDVFLEVASIRLAAMESTDAVKVTVVYESMFGNTRKVAQAISDGVREAHPDAYVECVAVGRASAELIMSTDLLIVGGPTHLRRMTTDFSRKRQISREKKAEAKGEPPRELEPDAEGPGLREWFHLMRPITGCRHAAAFATCLGSALAGSAGHEIARKLRGHGYELPSRFLILSNELPRFGDASGAIANRFVVLAMHESFLGKENMRLTEELTAELTGILSWALDGLDRLTRQGRFTEPKSSLDSILALQDLVSPKAAFVRDRCEVGMGCEISVAGLFEAWKVWAEENGHRHGTVQSFGRDIRAVVPSLRQARPRDGEDRERRYVGIRLKSTAHDGADRGPVWTTGQNSAHNTPNSVRSAMVRSQTYCSLNKLGSTPARAAGKPAPTQTA